MFLYLRFSPSISMQKKNKLQRQYIYCNVTIFYYIKTNFKQTMNKGLEPVS